MKYHQAFLFIVCHFDRCDSAVEKSQSGFFDSVTLRSKMTEA